MTRSDEAVPLLRRGDRVGVAAPGFAPHPALLRQGLAALRRAGYDLQVGPHVHGLNGYFTAGDPERAAELNALVRDRSIRAVWFVRGGYGCARLLPLVDWSALRRSGKLFIGYSDITALALAALRKPGTVWLYGPVVTEMGDPSSHQQAGFRRLLSGREDLLRFRRDQVVAGGRAEGRLIGGNLTVLAHLLGTRWMPSLEGAILALEDVGEETYRLDRLLNHLKLSGCLDRVAGVCLGRFDPPPARRRFPPDRSLEEVLDEYFGRLGVPVVRDLPFGHVRSKRVLPLGCSAELDGSARTLLLSPRPRP